MTSKVKVMQYREREVFDLQEAEFSDEDGRMFATVRILKAGLSKNNRNYRPEALRQAAQEKVFDGIRMFVNHSKQPPLMRPVEQMVSAVESTWYDDSKSTLMGKVEFFDQKFRDYAKRAQNYLGVSIDAIVRGDRIKQPNGRVMEDIRGFHEPKSVDWVLYPAAGGGIEAWEQEGEAMIDWESITEADIEKNLPSLWAKWHPDGTAEKLPVHGHGAQEAKNDDDDEEEDEDPKKAKKGKKPIYVKESEVQGIVQTALTEYQKEQESIKQKLEEAARQVREAFANAGLPPMTQSRLIASYEGVQEFDKAKVEKDIATAKEELKAAGAGPRISGMGPSNGAGGEAETKPSFSVHESVGQHFGVPAKKSDDSSGKES